MNLALAFSCPCGALTHALAKVPAQWFAYPDVQAVHFCESCGHCGKPVKLTVDVATLHALFHEPSTQLRQTA